jgi:urease accessory protein
LIRLDSVIGNAKNDASLGQKYADMQARGLVETISVSRLESTRVRMRKLSNNGTDVALTLPAGTTLRDGDVVALSEDKMIVVRREPESVAAIEIKEDSHVDELVELGIVVGHKIGNLHRPIMLEGRSIFFPIQADSELETFNRLFAPMREHLVITKTSRVFEPTEDIEDHEH